MTNNLEHIKHIDSYYLTHINDNLDFFLSLWVDSSGLPQMFEEDSVKEKLEIEWENALLGYPEILSIYYGNENGDFFNVPSFDLPMGYNPIQRPWYKKAIAAPEKVVWTSPYTDVVTGNVIFTVARSILDSNNDITGVLAIDVTLVEMSALLELTRIGKEGRIMVVDSEGMIIVSPDESILGESINDRPWAQKLFLSDSDSFLFDWDEPIVISYVTNEPTNWKVIGIVPQKELVEQIAPYRTLFFRVIFIVGVWAFFGIGGFIIYLHFRVIKPIDKLQKNMKLAESGDLNLPRFEELETKDEIGMLFISFNNMISGQKEILCGITDTSNRLNFASQSTLSIAKAYTDSAHEQAAEMEGLNASVERMNVSIHQVKNQMNDISKNIRFVSSAMKEMGLSSSDVANSAVSTSEAIADVLESLETLDTEIRQINANVHSLKSHGSASVGSVDIGKESLQLTSEEMNAIQKNSSDMIQTIETLGKYAEEIGDILGLIEDLTEQTGMLSLNASIEASRAGEHGKGFAAVASAIGRLSEKAKHSTRDIEKLINRIQKYVTLATEQSEKNKSQVERGVHQTEVTLQAFYAIENAVVKTSKSIDEIATSTERQLSASKSILNASMRVNDLTMLVSASSEEQLATVEELATAIQKIDERAESIAIETEEQSENSNELAQVSDAINMMTLEMSTASKEIESIAEELNHEAKSLLASVSTFKIEE